jgi:transcriptional regulator with XRE-family HTH domain
VDSLGARLKYYRTKENLTVRELAKRAGVSVSYIYAIEAGSRGHHIVKLERLAEALDVPLSELWKGEKA